jgi:hypothetical protein
MMGKQAREENSNAPKNYSSQNKWFRGAFGGIFIRLFDFTLLRATKLYRTTAPGTVHASIAWCFIFAFFSFSRLTFYLRRKSAGPEAS